MVTHYAKTPIMATGSANLKSHIPRQAKNPAARRAVAAAEITVMCAQGNAIAPPEQYFAL